MKTIEFTQWLEKFINFERWPQKSILNLKNMLFFANCFGNPQDEYKSIHIAGSKGKGSLSIMISSILREAGLKAGLYMSPHVNDFRERVSLAGEFFPDEVYSSNYDKIKEGFETLIAKDSSLDPSWFEIVTMLAFLLFKEENCDWGVFETGMGGRLDTTNILNPMCSVLTPIELEHCQYLGDTKEKIAFEKAGIIKKAKPVFCFEQEMSVLNVFKTKALEMSSPFYYLPSIIKDIKTEVTLNGLKLEIYFNDADEVGALFTRPIKTTLSFIDTVQAKNAALSSVVCKYLIPSLSEDTIEKGLKRAWLPARFEVLSKRPLVIVDGAHTEKSIGYSVDTMKKLTNEKCIVLFACADDKDSSVIAPLFKDIAKKIAITIPGTFKKSNIEKTTKDFHAYYANSSISLESSSEYEKVIQKCYEEAKKEECPLLITGSFYLVAEAKKIISH
ncbi:MAG: bifunctional folylpolyglutamate synthase/dihydrofolate synthase [Treponema sp.]